MSIRLLPSFASAGLVCAGFWIGGYDFDVRGAVGVLCFACSLAAFLSAYILWPLILEAE